MSKKEKVRKRKLKKKPAIGLPRHGIYRLAIGALSPRMKRFNVNIVRDGIDDIKPPFVVLSNHCSKQDWIFVGETMMPQLLNVVITRYYYSSPKLRILLKRAGAIPKDQFSPDIAAVKSIMSVAQRGGNIMLFPEGRMTPSGESETFERAVVKLLHHLKLPVIGIHMDGAYLTMPKWNNTPRKGRVDIRVFRLFTPEELDTLPDDEIYGRIVEKLRTDEYEWQRKNRVRFSGGDCTEGLQNVLYMCPKCGAELTTQTFGDTIKCSACGNGARLNEYYDLTPLDDSCVIPESIGAWYRWEVAEQNRRASEDESYSMSDHTVLQQVTDRKWLQPVGDGTASLDREGFHFDGVRHGEPFRLDIPLSMLPAVAFSPGISYELYYRGEFFAFYPEHAQAAQKWSMLAEQLHKIYCK